MSISPVSIAVVDGKTITQRVELKSAGAGNAVRIKAVEGGHYILAEGNQGFAPENITVKRVGKDLHVALAGTDPSQPELIIEGFYDMTGQLVGRAEDGTYYSYIASDAQQEHLPAYLMEDASAGQVLGGESLTGFADGLVAGAGATGWPLPLLVGLGALGLLGAGLALAGGGGGGGHDSPPAPAPVGQAAIGGVNDNMGTKQGPLRPGDITDDTTPTFTGRGTPGNTVNVYDNGQLIGTAPVNPDGTWMFTPTTPLDPGPHDITTTQTNPGGISGPSSPPVSIVVDTSTPSSPGIGGINDDLLPNTGPVPTDGTGITNDPTPTFTGRGTPGDTVNILDNGKVIGTAPVKPDGTWTFTPDTPLDPGPHDITTTQTNPAGTTGPASPPVSITVDTSTPASPGLGGINDDVGPKTGPVPTDGTGITDDPTPTFTGRGTPGDTVNILDNGKVIGTAPVNPDGTWTFTPDTPLDPGPHDITTTQTNPAGTTGPASPSIPIVIDPTAPDKPANTAGGGGIQDINDNVGPVMGPIAKDGIGATDDTTPTLHGSGIKASQTVIVYADGVEVPGTVVYDRAAGTWSFDPSPELAPGVYSFTVALSNAAGTGPQSDAHIVTLDTSPPPAPINTAGGGGIQDINDNVGPVTGPIAKDGIGATDDTTPTLHGSGIKASETVTVYADGVEVPGTVVYDRAAGTWSFDPSPALAAGIYSFTVALSNGAGTGPQSDPHIVTLDTSPPPAPINTAGGGGIQDINDNVGPVTGPIAKDGIGATDDTTPTLHGSGIKASETVTVYADGVEVPGTVVYDRAAGTWSFDPSPALAAGIYSFTVALSNAAGTGPQSDPHIVTLDTSPPPAPINTAGGGGIHDINDNVGPVMGPIAKDGVGYTDDTTPTLYGSGIKVSEAVTVYADAVEVPGTVLYDRAAGTWSFDPSPELAPGVYSFTVALSNAAGTGPQSDPHIVTLDTSTPAIPVAGAGGIDQIVDNVETITGVIPNDGVGLTNDIIPTLSGTGLLPGQTVKVYDDGVLVAGTITYGPAAGSWSFEPTNPLTDGAHVLTTSLTNGAGVEGPQSAGQTVTIDFIPPPVTLDSVSNDNLVTPALIPNGGTTSDNTPLVSGTGEEGSVVTVTATDSLGAVVTLAPVTVVGGVWSVNSSALADGTYTFSADASDGANHATTSATRMVTIDTVLPTSALVTMMGKDSGSSITDFLTNDGSAEHLVQGTLASALAAGEKVQISTDGGSAWVDAYVSGTNWSAVDPAVHTASWNILARVVDLAGNTTTSSQAVTLDTVAPNPPYDFKVTGQNVHVTLSDTTLVAGDLVNVISGNSRFQHVLTAAEVTAQSTTFTLPAGMPAPTGVAMADRAGNSSSTIISSSVSALYSFDGVPDNTAVPAINTFSGPFGGLTMDTTDDGAVIGTSNFPGYGETGQSLIFTTLGHTNATISGSFADAKTISFNYGANDDSAAYVEWFGTGGSLGTQAISGSLIPFTTLSYSAPDGVFVNSFVIHIPNGDFGVAQIDTMAISGFKDSAAPAASQTINITSDGAYYGGTNDNTFNLADVTYFSGANAGVHGNAGADTLVLTGATQTLDLTTLIDKLHSVETIDLTGTGNNTLKLSVEDVLDQGGAGLFDTASSKVQMMVKGNAGDVVNLEDMLHNGTDPGDWAAAAPVVVAGVTYDVYQHSSLNAELLVQQGVTTNLV